MVLIRGTAYLRGAVRGAVRRLSRRAVRGSVQALSREMLLVLLAVCLSAAVVSCAKNTVEIPSIPGTPESGNPTMQESGNPTAPASTAPITPPDAPASPTEPGSPTEPTSTAPGSDSPSGTDSSADPDSPSTGITTSPDSRSPHTSGTTSVTQNGLIIYLPAGLLPDAPYAAQAPQPRYYDNTTLELIPSNRYGAIMPYIGSVFDTEYSYLYGICDLSGRIICDPTFDGCYTIGNDETSVFVFEKTYGKGPGNESIRKNITVCALDGSWAQTYDEILASESCFLALKNEKWGLVGYDGRLIIPFQYSGLRNAADNYVSAQENNKWGLISFDNDVIIPFRYTEPLNFAYGFAAAIRQGEKKVWYIDETGEPVFGPYDLSPVPEFWEEDWEGPWSPINNYGFMEGFAQFYKDGKYGLIDATGSVVLDALYDSIYVSWDGFIVYNATDVTGLVSSDGTLVMEASSDGWFSFSGEFWRYYNFNKNIFIEILPDGTTRVFNNSSTSFISIPNNVVINGKTISLPGVHTQIYDAPSVLLLSNGNFFVRYNGISENYSIPYRWRVYDKGANLVADDHTGYGYIEELGGISVIVSHNIDGRYELYDPDGNRLLTDELSSVYSLNGFFMAYTELYSGIIDSGGNWIIKAPLLRTLPD